MSQRTEAEGSELITEAASGNPDEATVNLSAVLQESQVIRMSDDLHATS